MARPLTRAQALQNRAFLKVLRRTGNVRLACREVGAKYGTMQHRRNKHPAFALRWDAALAFAQARFERVGRTTPKTQQRRHASESRDVSRVTLRAHAGRPNPSLRAAQAARAAPASLHSALRTQGGEPHLVRLRSGQLQMRRAQPGKLTIEAEQAFLSALSATCNIRLACAAVGAAFNAFNRRRKTNPAFDREMRMALSQGYEALEMALLASHRPGSHEHDDWRHNDPPPIPPMSANQALQLMYLHQKAALLVDEPTPMRRRRGESNEARNERLALMSEARDRRHREEFEVAEADRRERGLPAWGPAGEVVRVEGRGPSTSSAGPPPLETEGRIVLPDLAQVTGWSNADPMKVPHDADRALFGGWRIEDMERELEQREWEAFEDEEPERAGPRVRRL